MGVIPVGRSLPRYVILIQIDTTNYIRNGGTDVSTGKAELLFENAQGETLGEPCNALSGSD